MPTFIVDVQDAAGNATKEKVDAVSEEQARSILQNRYPLVLKVKKAGINLDLSSIEQLITSVSVKDKAIFSRQFAAMVNAGVAMVRCLGVLADQCSNSKLKKSLLAISKDVEQGNDLSSAMAKHPECFDHLYVSMVQAGETGGVLDEVLNRLSKVLEDIARLQNQIKSAMAYPVVVGALAIIIFLAMTMFLIPVFAEIFEDIGTELPLLTKIMLEISKFLRSWKIVIPFIAVIVFVFVFRQYYKTPIGRLQIDKLKLKIPIFGDLVEKSAVARF
ncbi:MAG: type II secretion system F family protein, partial [Spirulinaceae cyanobacterium]